MLPLADILLLLALPVLLIASAFFSGSETALFSLSKHQQLRLSRSSNLMRATIAPLLSNPRSILITLLVANMTVNVAYFVISAVLLLRLRKLDVLNPIALGALSIVPLVVLILLGEVLPKLLASRRAADCSRLSALPLMVIHRVIAPLRVAFSALIIAPLARLIAPQDKPPALSPTELEMILEQSRQRGVLDRDEERLLQQVLELSQLKVRDLMTPRVDIKAHDLADEPGDLFELIRTTGHSHIPVYHENLDHIEGIVHARQLLLTSKHTPESITRAVRSVFFVPELQRADQLLAHFRKTGTTLAIAVDEFGGTAGLVALEDVVEQMVGEIAGPREPIQEPQFQQVEPGVWRVSANLPIHEWLDHFEQYPAMASLPSSTAALRAGVSTLGGLVMARLGRLPRVGDKTTIGNVIIDVSEMDHRRIAWLTIRLVNGAEASSPSPSATKEEKS